MYNPLPNLLPISSRSPPDPFPQLAGLGEALLAALLSAISSHASLELLPRVADALRTLLQCCGGGAREWLTRAVLCEPCGVLVSEGNKQQLVQAALELLDDHRSFRAMASDFSLLCRATALPPRDSFQTTIFVHTL